jgi:hypothetical protein
MEGNQKTQKNLLGGFHEDFYCLKMSPEKDQTWDGIFHQVG